MTVWMSVVGMFPALVASILVICVALASGAHICVDTDFDTPQNIVVSYGDSASPQGTIYLENCRYNAGLSIVRGLSDDVVGGAVTHADAVEQAKRLHRDAVGSEVVGVVVLARNVTVSGRGLSIARVLVAGVHIDRHCRIAVLRLDHAIVTQRVIIEADAAVQEMQLAATVILSRDAATTGWQLDGSAHSADLATTRFVDNNAADTGVLNKALSTDVPLWAILCMSFLAVMLVVSLATAANFRRAAAEGVAAKREMSKLRSTTPSTILTTTSTPATDELHRRHSSSSNSASQQRSCSRASTRTDGGVDNPLASGGSPPRSLHTAISVKTSWILPEETQQGSATTPISARGRAVGNRGRTDSTTTTSSSAGAITPLHGEKRQSSNLSTVSVNDVQGDLLANRRSDVSQAARASNHGDDGKEEDDDQELEVVEM